MNTGYVVLRGGYVSAITGQDEIAVTMPELVSHDLRAVSSLERPNRVGMSPVVKRDCWKPEFPDCFLVRSECC